MPKTHPTPKLVIFDCDGVLVDSETLAGQALIENLERHGLDLDLATCLELFVGTSDAEMMDIARAIGADLHEGWINEINQETHSLLQQGVPLVPGIPDLLTFLDRQNIPFCLASNGSEDKMRITLGQHGLWERFHPNAIFSADALGVAKPEPGLFLAAASHFDVQARECLVIEDSPSGALAAARAGMRCLGYAPEGGGARLAAQGAEVFCAMPQVPRLLGLA